MGKYGSNSAVCCKFHAPGGANRRDGEFAALIGGEVAGPQAFEIHFLRACGSAIT
jgi:hypothetical protein